MFTISSLLLLFVSNLSLLSAYPTQNGVLITAPPKQTYTGILQIPDPAHPYIAPGANDLRGPCPGLNTLANHGYLPRNGIVSFEDIVNATTHGFNMDYDLASALASIGMLSIGLDTPLIPPLPGEVDGPKARGLAAHGRIEGEHLTNTPELFDELLAIVAEVGDNSTVTGPRSVVNEESLSLFKLLRFKESQAENPVVSLKLHCYDGLSRAKPAVQLQYHLNRLPLSYGETGFTLNFFANGTDGVLSVSTMTSIFRDQRFPENWHRRSSPGTIDIIDATTEDVYQENPVPAGANAANGTYIEDPDEAGPCLNYDILVGQSVPDVLLNTTGILKTNVDFLLNAIHNLAPNCTVAIPNGAPNV
ncbi:hypothetical protein H0H92_006049 [Tricholoma furcatifolium]|nr:hypothetical protein H0H92_006049 [Tricholoma furcatifolium]